MNTRSFGLCSLIQTCAPPSKQVWCFSCLRLCRGEGGHGHICQVLKPLMWVLGTRCKHKAVCGHRRSLVIFFGGGGDAKRAQATGGLAVHTQGGAYTRRCIHKAVHTQGRLRPPQKSYYLRGGVQGLAPASGEASRSKGRFGGPHTRRCIHNTVQTQGRLCAPQESCRLRGGAWASPRVE